MFPAHSICRTELLIYIRNNRPFFGRPVVTNVFEYTEQIFFNDYVRVTTDGRFLR